MTKITIEQAIKELSSLLDRYDWFYDCGMENPRTIVVYVDFDLVAAGNQKAYDIIPDNLYGYQVKVWSYLYARCHIKYGVIDLNNEPEKVWEQRFGKKYNSIGNDDLMLD